MRCSAGSRGISLLFVLLSFVVLPPLVVHHQALGDLSSVDVVVAASFFDFDGIFRLIPLFSFLGIMCPLNFPVVTTLVIVDEILCLIVLQHFTPFLLLLKTSSFFSEALAII